MLHDQPIFRHHRLDRHRAGARLASACAGRRVRDASAPCGAVRATTCAWAGLVCVLLYTLEPVARDRATFSRPAGALRHARRRQRARRPRHPGRGQLHRRRQNKRWDLTATKQFSLSDQSRNVLAKLDAPLQITVFAQEPEFQRFRDRLKEYEYASKQRHDRVHRPRQEAGASPSRTRSSSTARSCSNYKGRTERVTTDTEQDITNAHHQGRVRAAAEGLLHAGPRREGHRLGRARRLQRDRRGARPRQLHRREAGARAAGAVPDDAVGRRSSPARGPTSSRPRSRR